MSLISSYIDVLVRTRPSSFVELPAVVGDYLERAQLQASSIDALISRMLTMLDATAIPRPNGVLRSMTPIEIEGGPHD